MEKDFAFSGLLYITLFITLNFYALLLFARSVGKIKIDIFLTPFVFGAVLFYINYNLLYRKGKADKIISEISMRTKNRLLDILSVIYALISIILCVIAADMARRIYIQ